MDFLFFVFRSYRTCECWCGIIEILILRTIHFRRNGIKRWCRRRWPIVRWHNGRRAQFSMLCSPNETCNFNFVPTIRAMSFCRRQLQIKYIKCLCAMLSCFVVRFLFFLSLFRSCFDSKYPCLLLKLTPRESNGKLYDLVGPTTQCSG